MKKYFIRRLLSTLPLVLLISFFAFVLIRLTPSDPALIALRVDGGMPTEEAIAAMRAELGIDQPVPVQYVRWVGKCLRGDFGNSYVSRKPVMDEFLPAFRNTLRLAFVSVIGLAAVSAALGVSCAVLQGRLYDRVCRILLFLLTAVPNYLIAILFIWVFSVKLKWLPTGGMLTPDTIIMPAAVMILGSTNMYVRLIRSSMVQNLSENYVLYLRACGVKNSIITRQVLLRSLGSALSALGMSIPRMVAGTFVVENIFAWPGIGRMCVRAVFDRDYPVIQAFVVLTAVFFLLCNLAVDVIGAATDPARREGTA